MGRVVHFEIPSENPERLKSFFADTFNWKFDQYGEDPYFLATTGADSEMGINGAVMLRKDPRQPMVNTINVKSIDDSIKRIEENGGTIVVPKVTVGDMGQVAYFKDPEGNIHGVWENAAVPGR